MQLQTERHETSIFLNRKTDMKILLIQLSDIHFTEEENSILLKEEQLFEAVRNSTLEYEEIFLLVTGDSAFSGKTTEYEIADKFLTTLKNKLEKESKLHCHSRKSRLQFF